MRARSKIKRMCVWVAGKTNQLEHAYWNTDTDTNSVFPHCQLPIAKQSTYISQSELTASSNTNNQNPKPLPSRLVLTFNSTNLYAHHIFYIR